MQLAWKKLSERIEKVGYRYVTYKTFEMPDGEQVEFTTIGRRTENAAVIAVTSEGKIVIARQYRPGPEAILDELPGGSVDDGETPNAAARRELMEETGYTTDGDFILIGTACRDAYKNAKDNYFIAYNCNRTTEPHTDATEFIEVVEVEIADLIENARTGKMTDGIAVLLAYDRLMEVQ